MTLPPLDSERLLGGVVISQNQPPQRVREGLVFDKWPFRADVSVEYQDWIVVVMCFVIVSVWCIPCFCGSLRSSTAKSITKFLYVRLHSYYSIMLYLTACIIFFTIGVLPDWTVDEFFTYLLAFVSWVLLHMQKLIQSGIIIAAFFVLFKTKNRIAMAMGLEHITLVRFNIKSILGLPSKQRPVELYVWKVEDVPSSNGKLFAPNDVFIECHLGHNEPMRTRVHHTAGASCLIRESFQLNIDENATGELMTLMVKDQGLVASSELGRLMLSTRELCGIEDQTGKRKANFAYDEQSFVSLKLLPRGNIWIAIAPVDDHDEERAPLMSEDALVTC